jgi:hypothetical protein
MKYVRDKIKELEDTTGTITYMLRLNPDHIDGAKWRQCSAREYFTARSLHGFGGMVETKTILNFYNGNTKEFVI